MLKRFRSKKFITTVAASVMTVVIGVTGLYAWFTSRVAVSANGSMGTLHVTAWTDYQMQFDYEPSEFTRTVDVNYKNDGSIATCFKVDLGHTSIGKAVLDNEGYVAGWLPEDQWNVNLNDPNIVVTPSADMDLGYYDNGEGRGWFYAWDKRAGHENDLYVFVDAGFEIEALYEVGFSPAMGNEYQGAGIDLSISNVACQTQDGAIAAAYNGLTTSDLELVLTERGQQGRAVGYSSSNVAYQKVLAMLHRMQGK